MSSKSRHRLNYLKVPCPECNSVDLEIILPVGNYMCSFCPKPASLICCKNCSYCTDFCEDCYKKNHDYKKPKVETKKEDELEFYGFYPRGLGISLVVLCLFSAWYFFPRETEKPSVLQTLKSRFPSQSNETWFHILSTLDTEPPTVKSLTLLYKDNKKTVNCIARRLVLLYTDHKMIDPNEFTFGKVSEDVKDYGEVLLQYKPLVKKHRVLVTDLNKVPAGVARIFHTLCDEVSSDIKPSFFIFTLQYDNTTSHLKRIQRTTRILKEKWSSLPDSDLFPLLSRVVKNVVDIVPEKGLSC